VIGQRYRGSTSASGDTTWIVYEEHEQYNRTSLTQDVLYINKQYGVLLKRLR
jgi:hypothetical protein